MEGTVATQPVPTDIQTPFQKPRPRTQRPPSATTSVSHGTEQTGHAKATTWREG